MRILQQPRRQTISLPDGSQLTLLKITYGTNHVCRYGNRWQDLLNPILPQKLRAKFPPRMMQFRTSGASLMVWLRHDDANPRQGWPPPFSIATADTSDVETRLEHSATIRRRLNSGAKPPAALAPGQKTPVGLSPVSDIIGWELNCFPRRTSQFKLRLYSHIANDTFLRTSEFPIRNPVSGNLPTWSSEILPATRLSNQVEFALMKLETGLTSGETGSGPAGVDAKCLSRATFTIKENGAATEKWSVCGISARNAAGEVRTGGSYGSRWRRGEHVLDFEGGLWLEESAWKLDVDFARAGDFPPDELWVIKSVSVPRPGELAEARVVTNLHFTELEFLGVSGDKAPLPEDYAGIQPHANIHVRTPHPMDGLRLVLVEVRNDQGRKLETKGSTTKTSMGGRGNTPREILHGFGVEIPEDAKWLDITFAATRVRRVEFFAKPVLFESNSKVRK